MQFESSILIAAPAAHVFSIYAAVANWPQWDVDVKSASIDGPFLTGATGVVVPHSGPKSKIVFSQVVRNQGCTVECKLPLCMMSFDYELSAEGEATRALHRVTFEGLLSPLFGRLIGGSMKKTLPQALAGLKAHAERSAPDAKR